jgi:hypothetical protein
LTAPRVARARDASRRRLRAAVAFVTLGVLGTACQLVSGGAKITFDGIHEPASCDDGQPNGDETGTDCGGSCEVCAIGQRCQAARDCVTRYCAVGKCAQCLQSSDCHDTPGTYCEAGACVPQKGSGQQCESADQCTSGFCPAQDGVCCDRACEGTCEACIKVKSGAPTGQCAIIPMGLDPDNDCSDEGAASCGSKEPYCSGKGPSCVLYPQDTPCSAPTCSDGKATSQGVCDGSGTCHSTTVACGAYQCDDTATACRTKCSNDAHCRPGFRCDDAGTCRAVEGTPCAQGSQCASDRCVDGVCCDAACAGACDACNLPGKPGKCSPRPAGMMGEPSCGLGACDGTSPDCPTG